MSFNNTPQADQSSRNLRPLNFSTEKKRIDFPTPDGSAINENNNRSREEVNRFRLGQKVDSSGWLNLAHLPPCLHPPLGSKPILEVKKFLTQKFKVEALIDKAGKVRIVQKLNQMAEKSAAPEKIRDFLKLPILQNSQDVLLKCEINPCRLILDILRLSKKNKINLKGGQARRLLADWIENTIQKNIDATLEVSPERMSQLRGKRPDWDFILLDPDHDFNFFLELNNIIYDDICSKLFGKVDPEFLDLYRIFIRTLICKTDEISNGIDCVTTVHMGTENNKIELVASRKNKNTQFFESHGLEISISIAALERWYQNPNENIQESDYKDVQICFDRVPHDKGLQAAFDIANGLLHSREMDLQNDKAYPRFIYWLSHHFKSPQKGLENSYLARTLPSLKDPAAEKLKDKITFCHTEHNMGNENALAGMIVNTVLSLKRTLPENQSEVFIQKFLAQFPETLFNSAVLNLSFMLLRQREQLGVCLSYLNLFSWLRFCGTANSSQIKVKLTQHEDRAVLQIIDEVAILSPFELKETLSLLNCADLNKIEEFEPFYTHLMKGVLFNYELSLTPKSESLIEEVEFEQTALKFLDKESDFLQKMGYQLLLISCAHHTMFGFYEVLLQKALYQLALSDDRVTLLRNICHAFKKSPYASVEDLTTLIDSELDEPSLDQIYKVFLIWFAKQDIPYTIKEWKRVSGEMCKESKLAASEAILDLWIPIDPASALNLYLEIFDERLLALSDEIAVFDKILSESRKQTNAKRLLLIPLLQKGAMKLLNRTPQAISGHGPKKKGQAKKSKESQTTLGSAEDAQWLANEVFNLSSDQNALQLLTLLKKSKTIESSDVWISCLRTTLKHPNGGLEPAVTLWGQAQSLDVAFTAASSPELILEVSELLVSADQPKAAEIVDAFLNLMDSSFQENEELKYRAAEIVVKRLDDFFAKGDFEKGEALLELCGRKFLSSTQLISYYNRIFYNDLSQNQLQKASHSLEILSQLGDLPLNEAFMLANAYQTLSGNLNEDVRKTRPQIIFLIEILLPFVDKLNIDQMRVFADLLDKLLNEFPTNQFPTPKDFKEKIKKHAPGIITNYRKLLQHLDVFKFARTLQLRQFMPELSENILRAIHLSTRASLIHRDAEPIPLETAHQFFSSLKHLDSTKSALLPDEQSKTYLLLADLLLESNDKIKASDWYMRVLDIMFQHNLVNITPQAFYRYVRIFSRVSEIDALEFLQKGLRCPHIEESDFAVQSARVIVEDITQPFRGCRALVECHLQLKKVPKDELKPIAINLIRAGLAKPNTEFLRFALQIIYNYELDDPDLIRDVFLHISKGADTRLLDEVWVFYKVAKNSGILEKNNRLHAYTLWRTILILKEARSFNIVSILEKYTELAKIYSDPEFKEAFVDIFACLTLASTIFMLHHEDPAVQLKIGRLILFARSLYSPQLEKYPLFKVDLDFKIFGSFFRCNSKLFHSCALEYLEQVIIENRSNLSLLSSLYEEIAIDLRSFEEWKLFAIELIKSTTTYLTPYCQTLGIAAALRVMEDHEVIAELASLVSTHIQTSTPPEPIRIDESTIIRELFIKIVNLPLESSKIWALSVLNNESIQKWLTPQDLTTIWTRYLTSRLKAALFNPDSWDTQVALGLLVEKKDHVMKNPDSLECIRYALQCCVYRLTKSFKTPHTNEVNIYMENDVPLDTVSDRFLEFHNKYSELTENFTGVTHIPQKYNRELSPKAIPLDLIITSYAELYAMVMGHDPYASMSMGLGSASNNPGDLLKEILMMESNKTPRNDLIIRYPFLAINLKVSFPNPECQNLFFEMTSGVISQLLGSKPQNVQMTKMILHFIQLQMQILLSNFPDRLDDLVELLDQIVFTFNETSDDLHNDLCMRLINKAIFTLPLLETHSKEIFGCLIYLYSSKLNFIFLSQLEHLDVYLQTLKKINLPDHPALVKKSSEIINEIPLNLLINQPAKLLQCMLGVIHTMSLNPFAEFPAIPFPAYDNSPSQTITLLDVVCRNIIKNKLLKSNHDPIWRQVSSNIIQIMVEALIEIYANEGVGNKKICLSYLSTILQTTLADGLFNGFYNKFKDLVLKLIPLLVAEIKGRDPQDEKGIRIRLELLEITNLLVVPILLSETDKQLRADILVEWVRQITTIGHRFIIDRTFETFFSCAAKLKLTEKCTNKQYMILERKFDLLMKDKTLVVKHS